MYDPKPNTWTSLDCIGYIPAPREGHSAALVNDVMYVFGGRTEEGTDLGDLAAFRISSRRWYTFQNMGPSPSPRSGHSMTAHGKQIVILAGEPSSAPRDPGELSMVYLLDTGKIRYPNDAPGQGAEAKQPNSPTRRPSTEVKNQFPPKRSQSREGQNTISTYNRSTDSPMGGPVLRPDPNAQAINSGGPVLRQDPNAQNMNSRLPRASMAQAPSGPPPQGQPPNPRSNGVVSPANGARGPPQMQRPPPQESIVQNIVQAPAVKEVQKENARPTREPSPGNQGRRTPTEKVQAKAKAMEAMEAAPILSSAGVARQRSLRSQRASGSIDSTEEGALGRSRHSDGHGSTRSIGDEPRSPRLNPHQEALVKELETTKRTNAWFCFRVGTG